MIYVLVFVFGLIFGSFLNVIIDRVPRRVEIVRKRSYCDNCKKTLKWYDLIPLISFVILRRKCRYCQEKISWQYPLVELATGLLFLIIFSRFADFTLTSKYFFVFTYLVYIVGVLLVIFVIDIKYFIVPDKIILPAIIISILLSLVLPFNSMSPVTASSVAGDYFIQKPALSASFLDSLFGIFFIGAIFLTLFLVSRGKWLGFGDVKFGILAGIIGGFKGTITIFLLTFFSAALVGIILLLFCGAKLKTKIPLASFMSAATLFVILSKFNFLEFIGFY